MKKHRIGKWTISYNPKPIPDRRNDYDGEHDDYDGEDGNLSFTCESKDEAIHEIEIRTRIKKMVDSVIQEMVHLGKLDIKIPMKAFERQRIANFFEDFEGGSRELSDMVDAHIMLCARTEPPAKSMVENIKEIEETSTGVGPCIKITFEDDSFVWITDGDDCGFPKEGNWCVGMYDSQLEFIKDVTRYDEE